MEGNDQLAVIVPMLKQVGAGISAEQLDGPTPCAAFTVSGVLDHMTGLASAYAPAFRGDPSPSDGERSAGSDHDPIARFQLAMDLLLDAVQSPGALQRTIESPFGPMLGSMFARLVAFDGLIHGWDLATSTQQAWEPPLDLVAEVDAFARQAIAPEMRAGQAFAQETQPPPDATPLLCLVAFTGRML
ncbi:MAG: TIGR03086 family metal-binding protein [Acidimicrobiales bacterium]